MPETNHKVALVTGAGLGIGRAAAKALGPKEVADLSLQTELKTPTMAAIYNKDMLKRMAPELEPDEIVDLRSYILSQLQPDDKTRKWLESSDGIDAF